MRGALAAGDRRRADLRLHALPGPRAQRRRTPRRRRVHHRPQAPRHRQRCHGRRVWQRTGAPFANPFARPLWNGWGPTVQNTHFQPAAQAGLTADQVPRLRLKWAFGFPDTTSAWAQPTIAGGRLFVGSQNGTVYSLDAATGCVAWTFAAQSGVRAAISIGRRTGSRPASDLRRLRGGSAGIRLRPRRRHRPDAVDQEGRRPPARAPHRLADAPRRPSLRPDIVVRRRRPASRLRLLHLPRQRRRARRGERRRRVEDLHDSRRAAAAARLRRRHRVARAGGRRDLVGADDRRQARGALRRRRQHLQRCRAADDRRDPGVRSRERCEALGAADAGGDAGCLRLHAGRRQLRRAPRARLRLRRVAGAGDAGDGPAADRRRTEVGSCLRARSRQAGPAGVALPRRRGSGLGGILWGIAADADRVYVPVAEIYNPAPGGLHAIDLATGKRAWHAPPETPVCGTPSRACSGAQFSAVSAIPGIVFSPSNDGAVRAYSDQRTVRSCGGSTRIAISRR